MTWEPQPRQNPPFSTIWIRESLAPSNCRRGPRSARSPTSSVWPNRRLPDAIADSDAMASCASPWPPILVPSVTRRGSCVCGVDRREPTVSPVPWQRETTSHGYPSTRPAGRSSSICAQPIRTAEWSSSPAHSPRLHPFSTYDRPRCSTHLSAGHRRIGRAGMMRSPRRRRTHLGEHAFRVHPAARRRRRRRSIAPTERSSTC